MANRKSLISLNKLHTYNYTIGSKTKVIHMSNIDSKDEEIKLLEEIDKSDDSKESKPKPKEQKTDDGIDYETNTEEDPDSEW